MQVVAALGDAPTAMIAVVAILLGVLFAARGPRDKRAADGGDGDERAPMMVGALPTPAAAPDTDPGFVGPAGDVVGHGRIRLGMSGRLGGGDETSPPEPILTAAPEPAPAPEPEPVPEPEPEPAQPTNSIGWASPAPPASPQPAAEPAFFDSPPTIPEPLGGAVALPDATPTPAQEPEPAPATEAPAPAEEPSEPREPAWRVAARAANSAVHFRQGTIKVGGKPIDKRKDQ